VSAPVTPTIQGSSSGNKVMQGIVAAYQKALTAPTDPNNASLIASVQSLTSGSQNNSSSSQGPSVNNAIQAHPEGYSSNMTIRLEHMAHITNTVLDRIHAPMTVSPAAGVYQDDEGRYIWADASGMRGTVNSYNDLAGFGYRLYNLTIGRDFQRNQYGGYGLFAGFGSSSMTESQQVTQNFNNTSFYLGAYGTQNFADDLKISGAAGYMYGMTDMSRSNPALIGDAGIATSSYKTNGVFSAVKLAKAFQMKDITVSPFVGASYSQIWMGGTTEQGSSGSNYTIASTTTYSAVTSAGVDLIYPLVKGSNNPLSLVGFYKFGYDWFANSADSHSVTATSSSTGAITLTGANMGPISNVFGVGLQGEIAKDVSVRVGIVSSINSYGQEYGGGAEVRVKF
jgi:uncharacterized protein with beta-barrel porin domain